MEFESSLVSVLSVHSVGSSGYLTQGKSIFQRRQVDRNGLKYINSKVQTLTIKDCKGPQTNMPKNVGSIKT